MSFIKPNYFIIQELVPSETYKKFGENSWMFLSKVALSTLGELRVLFSSPITINTWKSGGEFENRGFRTDEYYIKSYEKNYKLTYKDSNFYYGLVEYLKTIYSQHRFGNAWDFDVKGMTAYQAREKIRQWKADGFLSDLTRIETDINWLHVDCANVDEKFKNDYGLVEFKP